MSAGDCMKRIICCLVLIFLFLLSGCSNLSDDKQEQSFVKITDNIFFENVFDDYQSIFYYNNGEKDFIEQNSYIIKYSFDGSNFIAFHANTLDDLSNDKNVSYRTKGFGGSYYEIKKDYFIVYNIENSERIRFESQHEFVKYCEENELNLLDFKYSNGLGVMEYNEKIISDRVKLISFGKPFPEKILIDNEVIFEGYISDCSIKDDIVKFTIKIPDKAYLEFPSLSNPGIEQSSIPVSKYKTGILVGEDIFFDGEVKYDIRLKKVV